MFLSLKRLTKSSFKFIFRNFGIIFLNVLILTIVLFLFSSFLVFDKWGKDFLKKLEQKADFSVYFKEEVLEEEILKIKNDLSKFPEVEKIEYVSREEALFNFKERHKENPVLMEALKEIGNPFLASLNVRLKDPSLFENISKFLEERQSAIEKIDFFERKPLIEKIFSISNFFKKTMLFLILFFSFISFLIFLLSSQLLILNYKDEILTQRLVGASNFFIYFPFLFGGVFSGLLASLFSFSILFLSFFFISQKILILFPEVNFFDTLKENLPWIFLYQTVFGIFLGFFSSFFATRKHLQK